jgi:alpha-galactosidase
MDASTYPILGKISLAGDLGSGKSTVSKILIERLGAKYHSTGAICRAIAKEHGLDVVQIDDGWQTGVPTAPDADGNRLFDEHFWEVKQEVFPKGVESLAAYAKENGVALGLWFAPHSGGLFEYFDRDLSVLQKAHHDWRVRYFKLDMIHLPTREHCDKMVELLERIAALEGTSVELDVTADNRLGYLAAAPFGTIFVENRYTAWGNYYPHRTLRNEWMLSRYIPTAKLQFELVNPALCHDQYSDTDPFRHALYDADYLFATVMLSNPLFWMETQFLSAQSREQLKKIIAKWKCHREDLTYADVAPIGEEPSGASLTGFLADTPKAYHLLLFREATDRNTMTIPLPRDIKSVEAIAQNAKTEIAVNGNQLTATFAMPRSYAWFKIGKS